MTTAKVYVSADSLSSGRVSITGDEHHHLSRVLRMREGQSLVLLDGNGGVGEATIIEIAPAYTLASVGSLRHLEEARPRLHLYQAVPRGAKMDSVVQWSVELGAARVIPFSCSRSRDVDGAVQKRISRWRRIAVESSRVAGRAFLPSVLEALRWREVLESLGGLDAVLFADEKGGQRPDDALSDIDAEDLGLMIGPEGGFTDTEREELRSLGVRAVTLGESVLRTETAGLVLLAAVRWHYELV